MKKENDEDKEIQLSISTKELIDSQNDTYIDIMIKLINDIKVPSDKYFIIDNGFLHKIVRKDDELFYALVISIALLTIYCIKHMIH